MPDSNVVAWVLGTANSVLLVMVIGMLRPFIASYLQLRDDVYGKAGIQERLAVIEDRVLNAPNDTQPAWTRPTVHPTRG